MNGDKTALRRRLVAWYRRARRELPWRAPIGSAAGTLPDPYHVLVSETMLQQTRVATVVPYFLRFVREFPTIQALAAANEQRVLRLWQGLGYYNRARNLLSAARTVVSDFGGELPRDARPLRRLPGVGRYTAGAIASLAFNRREPVVDGNVARVLCRIDHLESDPRERYTHDLLWRRAAEFLPRDHPGEFNSALMELGATVCTPKSPRCLSCPIQAHCESFAAGIQDRIPTPRITRRTPLLRRRTLCIRRITLRGERWLIEQRPEGGRWAGMWQFVTRPVRGDSASNRTNSARRIGTISHALTHRRYRFDVYVCDACDDGNDIAGTAASGGGRWVALDELDAYPLPRPHVKIAQMLREHSRPACSLPILRRDRISSVDRPVPRPET